jgi:hypothetical protein
VLFSTILTNCTTGLEHESKGREAGDQHGESFRRTKIQKEI